jgi:hypothetical protein
MGLRQLAEVPDHFWALWQGGKSSCRAGVELKFSKIKSHGIELEDFQIAVLINLFENEKGNEQQ